MHKRILLFLAGGLLAAAALQAAPAKAVDRHITVRDFYIYPADSNFNKLAGFSWPEVKELNALVRLDVGGYRGEEKIDLFMVVFDEEGEVLSKHRGKHFLPAGEHELLFERFISTGDVFGDREFTVKLEAALKGCQPEQAETSFDMTGPDPPDVDILYLDIYNVQGGRRDKIFAPGDEFMVEAEFEIERNESSVAPRLMLYGAMEEDAYLIDPELEYQPYETQWDALQGEYRAGVYRLTASGRLPYYFAEPYATRHPFRLYLVVDFGREARTVDYARGVLDDYYSGEQRGNEDVAQRLIELNRSYTWELKRLRGARPDTKHTAR